MGTAARYPELLALARGQHGVVTRQQALAAGLPPGHWTRRLGGDLVPLLAGVAMVRVTGMPDLPGPRQRGQAALLATRDPRAALCLGSALRLFRLDGTPHNDPEHLWLPDAGWRKRPGLVRHSYALDAADVETRFGGLRLTSGRCSVLDAVRRYDRAHAVSILDSALRWRLITSADLEAYGEVVAAHRRQWLQLVDPSCESPLETRARLLFIDHELPFASQVLVQTDAGTFRVDFLVGRRTVVECDGREIHDQPRARAADRHREDALRRSGAAVVRVTWYDVERQPGPTLERIRAADEVNVQFSTSIVAKTAS